MGTTNNSQSTSAAPTTKTSPSALANDKQKAQVPASRAPGPMKVPAKVTDRLAEKFGLEPTFLREVVKSTISIAKKSGPVTDVELVGFMVACDQYGLNPFVNHIYAFVGRDGKVHPLVGVDGWLDIMHRQKTFGGIRFEFDFPNGDKSKVPISCTAIMNRTDLPEPIVIEEFLSECKRSTNPWTQMPRRMIRNASIKQSVRIGFGLASIYDTDDAKEIDPEGVLVDFTNAEAGRTIDVQPISTEQKLDPVEVEGTETEQAAAFEHGDPDGIVAERDSRGEEEEHFHKSPETDGAFEPPEIEQPEEAPADQSTEEPEAEPGSPGPPFTDPPATVKKLDRADLIQMTKDLSFKLHQDEVTTDAVAVFWKQMKSSYADQDIDFGVMAELPDQFILEFYEGLQIIESGKNVPFAPEEKPVEAPENVQEKREKFSPPSGSKKRPAALTGGQKASSAKPAKSAGKKKERPQDIDQKELEELGKQADEAIDKCKELEITLKNRKGIQNLRKKLKADNPKMSFTFQTPAKLPRPILFAYREGLQELKKKETSTGEQMEL